MLRRRRPRARRERGRRVGDAQRGQICMSVERVYVEAPVYDEFVAKVTDKVGALRQGVPGAAGSVDVGAITFPPQIDTIEAHVRDAVDKGARVAVGGHRGPRAGPVLRADGARWTSTTR